MANYSVYYTPSFNLEGKSIVSGTIKDNGLEAEKITFSISSIGQSIASPAECVFSALNLACEPGLQPTALYSYNSRLYLLLPNLEDKDYYITITAVDKAGNEIARVANTAQMTPEDRLAPGKTSYSFSYDAGQGKITVTPITPAINIDSTPFSNDLKKHYIFVQKDTSQNIIQISNLGRTTLINPSSGDRYYVAVISQDTSNNPIEIKQLSALEEVLEIKPEYQQIITELSNPQPLVIP